MYGKYSTTYAKWCKCYDPNNMEIQIIEKYCPLQDKRVLDIGCGTGRFLFRVLPMVERVIGVDNDSEAISVLKKILLQQYEKDHAKVSIYDGDIETFHMHNGDIDVAVFSWSFYALDENQMRKSLLNIHSLLNENGTLIILQPVGGQFEKIMRMFFKEHEDMDEYSVALYHMRELTSELYVQMARDSIFSEFVFTDLNMMCEAMKMFAVKEGGCKEEELPLITMERIREILVPYKIDGKYHLNDLVDVFIFKKKV